MLSVAPLLLLVAGAPVAGTDTVTGPGTDTVKGTIPNGTALMEDDRCYLITAGDREVGKTRQTVREASVDGKAVWDIVIHQRTNDGKFDMRDTFIVAKDTLAPLSLMSERGHAKSSPGWHRIAVRYSGGDIQLRKETAEAIKHTAHTMPDVVWDANLWGLTMAALPLKMGASFVVPTWHYDTGEGKFAFEVIGEDKVATRDGGTIDAWKVQAGAAGGRQVTYFIAKESRAELGYEGQGFRQWEGGDCSDM